MSLFNEAERLVRDSSREVRNRFNNMIRRAVVKLINDDPKQQALQVGVMGEEPQDDVEHFQMVGFTSHPPKGAEAVVIRVGGNGDHQIVISTADRESRPKVAEGACKVYHVDGTATVHLKGSGEVVIEATSLVDLGGGATKGVNREGDSVTADVTTDAAFTPATGWFAAITAAVNTLSGGSLVAPTSLSSKTGAGSSVVKAVD